MQSAIVASRSDFFATACWGEFKVKVNRWSRRAKTDRLISQEAQSHCIDLPEDLPTAVEIMLQYLYGLDYTVKAHREYLGHFYPIAFTDGDNLRRSSSLQLLANVHMYSMGDKYGIDGLKGIASENFALTLKRPEWQVGLYFSGVSIGALGTALECIYDSTPETDKGLRVQVLGYCQLHLKYLLTLKDFKAALFAVPEFSYQLLVQEAERRRPGNVPLETSEKLSIKKRRLSGRLRGQPQKSYVD